MQNVPSAAGPTFIAVKSQPDAGQHAGQDAGKHVAKHTGQGREDFAALFGKVDSMAERVAEDTDPVALQEPQKEEEAPSDLDIEPVEHETTERSSDWQDVQSDIVDELLSADSFAQSEFAQNVAAASGTLLSEADRTSTFGNSAERATLPTPSQAVLPEAKALSENVRYDLKDRQQTVAQPTQAVPVIAGTPHEDPALQGAVTDVAAIRSVHASEAAPRTTVSSATAQIMHRMQASKLQTTMGAEQRESEPKVLQRLEGDGEPSRPPVNNKIASISPPAPMTAAEPGFAQNVMGSRPLDVQSAMGLVDETASFEDVMGLSNNSGDRSAVSSTGVGASVMRSYAAPQQLAAQIAEVLKTGKEGAIEVTLKPQELGQVRMIITQTETGLQVVLGVERPETADLLRRNADVLLEEFADAGFGDVAFSFDDTASGDASQDEADDRSEPATRVGLAQAELESDPDVAYAANWVSNGLDIRI